MIEERAQVVAIDHTFVWVEAQRESACSRCAANKGCGSAVLQKLFAGKRNILPVSKNDEENLVEVKVGDNVVIGVEENALVRNSVIVYAIPLLVIVVFAVLGETFLKDIVSISKDLAGVTGAIIGLIFSIYGLRWFNRVAGNKSGNQPVLLRTESNVLPVTDIKILS